MSGTTRRWPRHRRLPAEHVDAEDPLFILYTSGSTGKRRARCTHGRLPALCRHDPQVHLRLHDGEVFWCTADVGWVTGHTYIVYGPLANGAISVMFEASRPIRRVALLAGLRQAQGQHLLHGADRDPLAYAPGDDPVTKCDLSSLRLLGSVGEPINPEAWSGITAWSARTAAPSSTPGGRPRRRPPHHPVARATALKPGSATLPFFGVVPAIVDASTGHVLEGECEGALVITRPWPAQMRTVFGDHKRFKDTYFTQYPGNYFTATARAATRTATTGSPAESTTCSTCPAPHRHGRDRVALVLHDKWRRPPSSATRTTSRPGIYAYVTPMAGIEPSDELKKELVALVRKEIGRSPPWTSSSGRPACEDPLRQDHAPHPAQDRRERDRRPGGHLDAGRSDGGRRPGPHRANNNQQQHRCTATSHARHPPGVFLPAVAGRRSFALPRA